MDLCNKPFSSLSVVKHCPLLTELNENICFQAYFGMESATGYHKDRNNNLV